ncbi:MAG: hypothetical protein Kow0083_14760 [Methylophaga sp.]
MFATKLKTQLLLITILPLLLTIAFISLFILVDVLNSIENEIVKRSENIASQAAIMSEFPLYTGDTRALKEIAEMMIRVHNLAFVSFTDSSGQLVLYETDNTSHARVRSFQFPIYSQAPNLDDFSDSIPVQVDRTPLGSIEIGLTNNSAETQRFHAYIKVLSTSLLALALGLLLVYLFSRRIGRVIGSLIDTAKKLEQKDFTARVDENGSGELLQFQRTFNDMIASLEQNDIELQKKINAATASLNYTVKQLSEKNRALAQQRQETIELERSKAILEERERIMRDMHDGIGGQLVAALSLIEREQDSALKHNIHAVLTECLNDLRLIIHSLNTQNNVMASLLADFKYRTSRKLEQLNMELDWEIGAEADDLTVKPQTGLHLLRILQEAFTNILKHARASHIRFRAYQVGTDFQITIEDNGHFQPDTEALRRGHGISNMKSRAAKLGGSLDIEKINTRGCRLILTFPLDKPSP